MKSKKIESLEEYLARGGVIKVLPPDAKAVKEKPTKQDSNGGPAVILTMDQYDTYYGEVKVSKKKPKKPKATLDVFALPEHLRKKHLGRLLEEAGLDEEDLKKN
jgi:hypothetical protein